MILIQLLWRRMKVKKMKKDDEFPAEKQMPASRPESQLEVGDWVLVCYKKVAYIGAVLAIRGNLYKVKCMHSCGEN